MITLSLFSISMTCVRSCKYSITSIFLFIEFDLIAIVCEYSELTIDELRDNYSVDKGIDVIEYLQENTIVIEIENSDSVIIQDY